MAIKWNDDNNDNNEDEVNSDNIEGDTMNKIESLLIFFFPFSFLFSRSISLSYHNVDQQFLWL